jgi:hypothetical protein
MGMGCNEAIEQANAVILMYKHRDIQFNFSVSLGLLGLWEQTLLVRSTNGESRLNLIHSLADKAAEISDEESNEPTNIWDYERAD